MALQDNRAPRTGATGPRLINVRTADTAASADPDGVLLAGGGLGGVVATADAGAEEEVVVRAAVVDEAPLLGVVARGIVCDLVAGGGDGCGGAAHWGLVDCSFAAESVK